MFVAKQLTHNGIAHITYKASVTYPQTGIVQSQYPKPMLCLTELMLSQVFTANLATLNLQKRLFIDLTYENRIRHQSYYYEHINRYRKESQI